MPETIFLGFDWYVKEAEVDMGHWKLAVMKPGLAGAIFFRKKGKKRKRTGKVCRGDFIIIYLEPIPSST